MNVNVHNVPNYTWRMYLYVFHAAVSACLHVFVSDCGLPAVACDSACSRLRNCACICACMPSATAGAYMHRLVDKLAVEWTVE